MSRRWLGLALTLAVSCKKETPKTAAVAHEVAEHEDEKEHGELPKQLQVSPEIARDADLQTVTASRGVLDTVVGLPGEIVNEPDRTAHLSCATSGILEKVSFNEGSKVRAGDVLATLRVPDVGKLRGAFLATTQKAKAARANSGRLRALKEQGLGAEQTFVDADAEAGALEAEAKALSEQLGAIGVNAESGGGFRVPLRASISGIVVSRSAVVGQPVAADHVLATIVDLSEVWFLGRVFEKDLGRLRVGAKTEVKLNAFQGESFAGEVDYVGQQTDPVARTLTARIRLKNESHKLRLGLFGTAYVAVAENNNANPHVIVPLSSVAEVGDKKIVFVKAKDGDFVVHEVTLGNSALGRTQILTGLDEGEDVVSSGVFTLKSLLLKSTLHEDEH